MRKAGFLSEEVVCSIKRRLPPDILSGSDEATGRRSDVLMDGLASRVARSEYMAACGWLGRWVFVRKLREDLLKAGYKRPFAEATVKRLMLKR